MRAPVYRHIEAESSIAGLSLTAFILVLGSAFLAIQFLPGTWALGTVLAVYLLLRILGHGRAPLYWQHEIVWRARMAWCDGRLSAAARSRAPRFPFGPYGDAP